MKLDFGRRNVLPILIQAEAGECGLACLAMIACYHGSQVSLATLRQQHLMSSRGVNLQAVIDIASHLGLASRALRLEAGSLSQLGLPAILHWNFDHFVVLKKVSRRAAVIHDPAVGVRRYSLGEIACYFTGVALELTPRVEFTAQNKPMGLSLRSFWTGVRGLRRALLQLFFLSLLIQIFALLTPLYLQTVVDDVLTRRDTEILSLLALGFLAVTLLSVLSKVVRGFVGLYLTNQLSFVIGDAVMHHLLRLPLSYFEKRHMGDIVSRFQSSQAVQRFISETSVIVAIDGIRSALTLALMFAYSPKLATIVIAAVVLYGGFRLAQFQPLREASLSRIAISASLESVFMESLRALQGIKLANREMARLEVWRNQFVLTMNAEARVGRLAIGFEASNALITGVEYVLLIYMGSQQVLAGALSIGMLYAFVVYRAHFSGAMISMVNQWVEFLMLRMHLDRLEDITGTTPEIRSSDKNCLLLPVKGDLALKAVNFRYSEFEPAIFTNLNLSIDARETVAIFAPSGAGKTTLLKILMGLLEPTDGQLLVDGIPLSQVGLLSLRSRIAAVMQNDSLLSGSLRENIAFMDMLPDAENIVVSAKLACIHDDIMQLPMTYEARIGDMGSALSVGQQQRLLLARALYRKPKVLFLDEGTAHIDAFTEMQIFKNLGGLPITCVFSTHNPALLRLADKVVNWNGAGFEISRQNVTK